MRRALLALRQLTTPSHTAFAPLSPTWNPCHSDPTATTTAITPTDRHNELVRRKSVDGRRLTQQSRPGRAADEPPGDEEKESAKRPPNHRRAERGVIVERRERTDLFFNACPLNHAPAFAVT